MLVRAPGKIVLSGAYAVLRGAPAIVTAVDRYALADSTRAAEFVTPEVRQALANEAAALGPTAPRKGPWFDASELRDGGSKLGLGSSAAILVASLGALKWAETPELDEEAVGARLLPLALAAHREAQGGGSGIDVVASTFGGSLIFQTAKPTHPERVQLPASTVIEVWSSGVPSSTARLVARFAEFEQQAPGDFARLLAAQAAASEGAATAVRTDDVDAFIAALQGQRRALEALGNTLGEPIVTAEVRELADRAEAEGGALLPAGAGGGDVACFVGRSAPSAGLRRKAEALGHVPLALRLGARGMHRVEIMKQGQGPSFTSQ